MVFLERKSLKVKGGLYSYNICGCVRTPDRCGSPFGVHCVMVGKAQQQEVDPAGYFPSSQETERNECSPQVSPTFSLSLGHQSVVEPHLYFWVGLPISTHLEKSLLALLEVCLLGDSRSC